MLALTGFALTGCVTGGGTVSVWPGDPTPGRVRYFYIPSNPPMPEEQAIGTIKNLQTRFCTWEGNIPSVLDVDRYGLRVRANWTETTSGTNYIPSYGGIFAGDNYIPVMGGSNQPWQKTEAKEQTVIIPFDKVNEIRLTYYGDINRDYKWGVYFGVEGIPAGEAFRFPDQGSAVDFAAAISSLARARGRDLSRKSDIGLWWADLNPAQVEDLTKAGFTASKVILWVYKDGPAERAGLRSGDVIRSYITGKVAHEAAFQVLRRGLAPGGTVPGWTETEIKVRF